MMMRMHSVVSYEENMLRINLMLRCVVPGLRIFHMIILIWGEK